MVMDTLAGVAFAYEPPLIEYMNEKPKKKGEHIVNKYMFNQIIANGLYIAVLCLVFLKTNLFRGIYVENFFYAIISALILSLLNSTIKPILIFWTLPLSIVTFGIAYPVVNMIILKLCDIFMGNAFGVSGFFSTFIVAIFISGMRMLLDQMITKKVGKRK